MIAVVCMLWHDPQLSQRGARFTPCHVRRLRDQVARHLAQPHRFVCITGKPEWLFDIETAPLDMSLAVPGKHTPKLQLFRRDAGELVGAERILYLDLDSAIVGPLDPLVDRDAALVLLENPSFGQRRRFAPFSSAVMLIRAGALPAVYDEFVPHAPLRTSWGSDDCDWISMFARPDIATYGPADGIHDQAVLRRPWSSTGARSELPDGARLITFRGARMPWDGHAKADHPWLADA